jgi:hypothetical protein
MLTETDIKASDSSSEYDFGLDDYSTDEEGEASFRLSGTPLNPPLQTKFTTTVLHRMFATFPVQVGTHDFATPQKKFTKGRSR